MNWPATPCCACPFPASKAQAWGKVCGFLWPCCTAAPGRTNPPPWPLTAQRLRAKKPICQAPYDVDPLPCFCPPCRVCWPGCATRAAAPALWGPRLRVANVLAYEDAAYRQTLALWRGRGHRLMYVQHGSDYGQVRCLTEVEMVEYAQHAFATWVGAATRAAGATFCPCPTPSWPGWRALAGRRRP